MVATPSGRLYHRPCLILYMGNQTEALQRQREAWQAQQLLRASKLSDSTPGVAASTADAATSGGSAVDKLSRDHSVRIVAGAKGMLSDAARSTSHWRPEALHEQKEELLVEPPKRPPSPQSGAPLRLKHLASLNPHRIQPDGTSGPDIAVIGTAAAAMAASSATALPRTHPDDGLIACALTGKPIKHSKAVAIAT